jgi:hormone-sensitive lipase
VFISNNNQIDNRFQFPPVHLLTTDVDPCLDETVAFANKLVRGGAPRVTLDVLGGLPHGFLSLNGLSTDCRAAVDLVTKRLKKFLPNVF